MHLLVEEFLKDNLEFKLDVLETLENHREEFIDWRRRPKSKRGQQPQCRSDAHAPGGRCSSHAQTTRAHSGRPLGDAGPTGT